MESAQHKNYIIIITIIIILPLVRSLQSAVCINNVWGYTEILPNSDLWSCPLQYDLMK